MASTPTLRLGEPSADPEGPAVLREAAPVRGAALAAVGAAAFLLVALLLGDGERGQPAFLRAALGPEASESALERSPAPGVEVSIDDDGYTVARRGSSVSVAAEDTSGEEWELYAHGASRLTDFGRETIVVDGSTTESFLTVTKRQGPRTWRWRLETRLVPRLARDGGVSFLDPTRHRDTALAIEPAAILDADGDDVTPEGLRWGLVLAGGEWWLALDLDDSDLPLPYVIDPAVEYPSPLYLSNEVSAATGSWRLVTAPPGTLDMTTGTETCRNCPGYWQWIPGAANAAEGTPSTTPPPTYSAAPFGSAARRPDLRPQPLAEQVQGDGRKPLGFGLLVLAFGAALLAGLRLVRRARPARPRATGPEPLLLCDARLLRSATSAARRLAGRG